MKRIDINADMGESYGSFKVGDDEKLISEVTSANIACGYHAGDHSTMANTIKLAKSNGVGIGAHPGFNDLYGFGRRSLHLSSEEIYQLMVYQIGAIQAFCKIENIPLIHVKPHGALYNIATENAEVAEAIAKAVYDTDADLILFGLYDSELIAAGKRYGLRVAREAFADRAYTEDGKLASRKSSKSIYSDINDIEEQVLNIVTKGVVTSVNGKEIEMKADTICFHGDNISVYNHVKYIKTLLLEKGVHIKNVGE